MSLAPACSRRGREDPAPPVCRGAKADVPRGSCHAVRVQPCYM